MDRRQFLERMAASVPAVALLGRTLHSCTLHDHIFTSFLRKDCDGAISDEGFRNEYLVSACTALLAAIGLDTKLNIHDLSKRIIATHMKDDMFWLNRNVLIRWKRRYEAIHQGELYLIDGLIYAQGIVLEEHLWKPSQPATSTQS